MDDTQNEEDKIRGRFLRVPAWASVCCTPCGETMPPLSRVSIQMRRHRLISRKPSPTEAERRRGTADGLLFDSSEEPQRGAILEMQLSLQPGADPFRIRCQVAEVKRCATDNNRYHLKVFFMSSGDEETETVTKFIKDHYS